ncbi:MAG TPA: metallophosphoesterase [Candidatus Binatia bacterium]|nr:metallophosphoesterase [Candidatus Binatia bacterium]
MKKNLFVVSDLHLGGSPEAGGRPGFQMCSAAGRARLAEFIDYIADQRTSNHDIRLVLAGDIVDFLAEEEFETFTGDENLARKKLERIMERTGEVWHALANLVTSGVKLTLLLGNHDIELSLSAPRNLLLDRLGSGNVEFIYDNQAFTDGPVIIEHGNRYDSWNVIDHDALREVRSALSRRETPPKFDCPAGSLMVVNIMNRIKSRFPFVDLLKPEDAALLPLLAVLDPSSLKEATKAIGLWRKQSKVEFDRDGVPIDVANIASSAGNDEAAIDLAMELYGEHHGDISFVDDARNFYDLWQLARTNKDKDAQLLKLYTALRARAESTWQTLDVNCETEQFINPAKAAAARGFKVVVFGHTHLVKRVPLDAKDSVYLNTGTWADLMQVPEAVLNGDEPAAKRQLENFVNDLAANQLETWRRQVPTFARIDLDSDAVTSADVYFFDGANHVRPVPNGRLTRLAV